MAFQLISDDSKIKYHYITSLMKKKTIYSPNFTQFLQNSCLFKQGSNYILISIIGTQSSGKSTLLNHLFKTNFDVMNVRTARKQTTKGYFFGLSGIFIVFLKGIWFGKDQERPFLIMDVEGTDSAQHWGEW